MTIYNWTLFWNILRWKQLKFTVGHSILVYCVLSVCSYFFVLQCLTETGTIIGFLNNGQAVRTQYEDDSSFLINRNSVYRVKHLIWVEEVQYSTDSVCYKNHFVHDLYLKVDINLQKVHQYRCWYHCHISHKLSLWIQCIILAYIYKSAFKIHVTYAVNSVVNFKNTKRGRLLTVPGTFNYSSNFFLASWMFKIVLYMCFYCNNYNCSGLQ